MKEEKAVHELQNIDAKANMTCYMIVVTFLECWNCEKWKKLGNVNFLRGMNLSVLFSFLFFKIESNRTEIVLKTSF